MSDMRLPGLGLPGHERTPIQTGNDAVGDAAQDFDAVMSRYGGERPGPAATPRNDRTPAKTPADAARPTKNEAVRGSTSDGASRAASSKPEDGDDACDAPAAMVGATDPAALPADITGAAALAVPTSASPPAPIDPAKEGSAKSMTVAHAATPLDGLGGHANAVAARDASKTTAEVSRAEDDDATPARVARQNRRAPASARDTLRIDPPLTHAIETRQGEVAQRVAEFATPLTREAAQPANAAPPEAAPLMLGAAVGANGASPATYSIAHAAVGASVGTSAFADEFGNRVAMFAGQKVQRADIAITPADLGPIAVSIEVRGQEATLAFAAASHVTRAAIEDALPKLRDMLSAQGLHLAGAHVGSEPRRDPYRPAHGAASTAGTHRAAEGIASDSISVARAVRRRVGFIDIEV